MTSSPEPVLSIVEGVPRNDPCRRLLRQPLCELVGAPASSRSFLSRRPSSLLTPLLSHRSSPLRYRCGGTVRHSDRSSSRTHLSAYRRDSVPLPKFSPGRSADVIEPPSRPSAEFSARRSPVLLHPP